MIRIAINGFGHIGRNFLRAVLQDPKAKQEFKIVAINIGPSKPEMVAHLFKYDTLLGIYPGTVIMEKNTLVIDDYSIAIVAFNDPAQADWGSLAIDWVVEASGKFTKRAGAELHIKAGAKKVLITAPTKDEDITIIPGVNSDAFDAKRDVIVSLGSCTTNALVPTLKVLHDAFTITQGFMTTVHAYTNSQVLIDVERSDPRRARAAALNIIPTTTGATDVLGKVLPELQGLIGGCAIRVPVAKVSIIDLTFVTKKPISKEAIHDAFDTAAKNQLRGILAQSMEPLVSSDYSLNPYSVTIDGLLTDVRGNCGKVFGWYDNEWGYSERLKDFLLMVA
jgi:glyceraldehyde 3-phosphate dehydrogenase